MRDKLVANDDTNDTNMNAVFSFGSCSMTDSGDAGSAMRRPITAEGPTETDMNMQSLEGKTQAELLAIIAQMAVAGQRRVSLKVTEKGGLSMYGLGRFPVTLYRGQWERLLSAKDDILAFIEANASSLSVKD